MRQLNWAKINPRQMKGTMWESIDDEAVKYDKSELEFLFAAKATVVIEKEKDDKPSVLILLPDSKRWQNTSIVLSQFSSLSFEQLRDAIIRLDDVLIDVDGLMQLCQFTPTTEEKDILATYVDEAPPNLGKPERYFIAVMGIPRLQLRLEAWHFKRVFDEKFAYAQTIVSALDIATTKVRQSTKLRKVLQTILAFGNYMNGGTNRGAAFGFKLDSLLRLTEVRSDTDNGKTTAMHYIIEMLTANYPDAPQVVDDLHEFVKEAAKQKQSTIRAEVTEIKIGLSKVENFLKTPTNTPGDAFPVVMNKWFPASQAKFTSVEKQSEEAVVKFKELVTYFGEAADSDTDSFFGILDRFLTDFDKAAKDIKRRKELQEKSIRASIKINKANPGAGNNLMDSVLGELVSGAAFTQRRAPGGARGGGAAGGAGRGAFGK